MISLAYIICTSACLFLHTKLQGVKDGRNIIIAKAYMPGTSLNSIQYLLHQTLTFQSIEAEILRDETYIMVWALIKLKITICLISGMSKNHLQLTRQRSVCTMECKCGQWFIQPTSVPWMLYEWVGGLANTSVGLVVKLGLLPSS